MKKGYHSTQRKIWGTIPASEFYGFVIGYAVAMILIGLFDWETTMLPIFLAFIGVGIGCWYDRKFFYVKDEPEGEEISAGGEDEAGTPSAGERASDASPLAGEEADDASMQRQIRKSFDRLKDRDDDFPDDEHR